MGAFKTGLPMSENAVSGDGNARKHDKILVDVSRLYSDYQEVCATLKHAEAEKTRIEKEHSDCHLKHDTIVELMDKLLVREQEKLEILKSMNKKAEHIQTRVTLLNDEVNALEQLILSTMGQIKLDYRVHGIHLSAEYFKGFLDIMDRARAYSKTIIPETTDDAQVGKQREAS